MYLPFDFFIAGNHLSFLKQKKRVVYDCSLNDSFIIFNAWTHLHNLNKDSFIFSTGIIRSKNKMQEGVEDNSLLGIPLTQDTVPEVNKLHQSYLFITYASMKCYDKKYFE